MQALRLDGNAVAGTLRDVFTTEVTTAIGTCGNCGAVDAVGAVHVYVSAGIVLRCPHCESVLLRLVQHDTRIWLDLTGMRSLELDV
jgi:Family of unknown function (DUF6510)